MCGLCGVCDCLPQCLAHGKTSICGSYYTGDRSESGSQFPTVFRIDDRPPHFHTVPTRRGPVLALAAAEMLTGCLLGSWRQQNGGSPPCLSFSLLCLWSMRKSKGASRPTSVKCSLKAAHRTSIFPKHWVPLSNFFSVSLNFMCQLWFTLLFTNFLPSDLMFLGRNVQKALGTSWATYRG